VIIRTPYSYWPKEREGKGPVFLLTALTFNKALLPTIVVFYLSLLLCAVPSRLNSPGVTAAFESGEEEG
jgi:hypothetical protein